MLSTLRNKILLGFGLTLLLAAIVMLRSITLLLDLGNASASILKENYKSILAAEGMINALERQDSAILLSFIGMKERSDSIDLEGEADFLQWLGRSKDNITIGGEKEILDTIERNYQEYRILLHSGEKAYQEILYPAFLKVREECEQLRQLNQDTMYAASTHAEHIASGAVGSMSILGALFLLLGFGFSFFIAYLITRPLREMIEATGKIAEGQYDIFLKIRSNDELGRLSKSINDMAAGLKRFHELNIGEILFEKRRSEAVIRSIDDGIVFVNESLEVAGMNPAAEKIFSASFKTDEQKHFIEMVQNDRLYQRVKAAGRGEVIHESDEYFMTQDESNTRYYSYSVTPVLVGKRRSWVQCLY
jgi:NtrC-family two-component system sensor histidine kinase KinB